MATRKSPGWMPERERRRRRLPKHCECGGRLLYQEAFGRIFSACEDCTPLVIVKIPRFSRVGAP